MQPLYSGHILPWDSHVPLQRKIALLTTERTRAVRNTSDISTLSSSLSILKDRFLANNYPVDVINKYLLQDHNYNRSRQLSINKPVFLKFPFVNDSSANQIRRKLYQTKLPMKIIPIFVTAPPLSVQIQSRSPIPCPSRICICNHRHLCLKKNFIYHITCNLCQSTYIGETHRTLHSRINEHLSKHSGSLVFEHFNNIHNINISLDNISFKILKTGFQDSLQRKAAEKSFIRQLHPDININFNS